MNKKKLAGEDYSKEVKKLSKEHGLTYNQAVSLIRYTVWDVITLEEYEANESKVPYFKRLKAVERLISSNNSKMITLIYSREVSTYQEAIQHFQEVLAAGEEGTIVKAIDGEWKDGKPNWQVKLKLEMHVDLRITGFQYGTGKNEKVISTLHCESECGKLKTSPTGLTEKMMKYITDNQASLKGTIMECKCSGMSQNSLGEYSLLHPQFSELRADKTTADDLEAIKKIEEMEKGLTSAIAK